LGGSTVEGPVGLGPTELGFYPNKVFGFDPPVALVSGPFAGFLTFSSSTSVETSFPK
jgi:hypothetical protein